MVYRVETQRGELITACLDLEMALRLCDAVERAARVVNDATGELLREKPIERLSDMFDVNGTRS